ncbi:MAG: porphobilinogen synthase [Candidatus Nitrosocaldus sp.]|nr:porphobilinogen synthase [Candidatus Nitrosocaldus sp.]MDW7999904.1 porphobilinogen synthase [Candidatus Nitrosocaldus sp.]
MSMKGSKPKPQHQPRWPSPMEDSDHRSTRLHDDGSSFPSVRLRRLRRSSAIRDMLQESRVDVGTLVYPVFVQEGIAGREPIQSMPGQSRLPVSLLVDEVRHLLELGIRAIILFGIPSRKDEYASSAYAEDGIVQRAVSMLRKEFSSDDLTIITDVCTCQYTSHGHCGIVDGGRVDNDSTLGVLARIAVSHANAGADIVAPSAMMDGQVRAIRDALDDEGFKDVLIMSYSAKYSSSLYSPFRSAADSAPRFGDRKSYQLHYTNAREALREIEQDVREGVDIIMVKPAIAYLDVIRLARDTFRHPLAAYSVSGEYALVKAAALQGLIDEDSVVMELLSCIRRAGADIIITYFAKRAAEIINGR